MTAAEEPLWLAVLDDPDDLSRRSVYADWLQETGDPRGDYLRLLLELHPLKKGDPRIREIRKRLATMRLTVDRHWAAILDEFDARVREVRTIRLRIHTYGSAPKKYSGATKVGFIERSFLVRAGWEHAGDGTGYSYVRPPGGVKAKNPVIEVEVPTDEGILRIASAFHERGENVVRSFGPWMVQYQAAGSLRARTRVVLGDDQEAPWQEVRGPAEFEFGLMAPWGVRLLWRAGEDPGPHWSRSEGNVVK